MKYLRKFNTVAEYTSAEKDEPNVCYIVENDSVIINDYNPIAVNGRTSPEFYQTLSTYDTDNDGNISKEEALAITSYSEPNLDNRLRNSLSNMDGFKYLTNLTSINMGAFNVLQELRLPKTTNSCKFNIGGVPLLTKIVFPEGGKIWINNININSNIKHIVFPASLTVLGNSGTVWSSSLQYVVFKSPTVIHETSGKYVARDIPNCPVYVPDYLVSQYQTNFPTHSSQFKGISYLDEDIVTNEWEDYKND